MLRGLVFSFIAGMIAPTSFLVGHAMGDLWGFALFGMAAAGADDRDGDLHAPAVRTAGLLCSHAAKTGPAPGEITGIVSCHTQASLPVPQQSSRSERLEMLNLEDSAAYTRFPLGP